MQLMAKKLVLFLSFWVISLLPAHAQDSAEPLILWSRGDLYATVDLTALPVKLTDDGNISGPALSPDAAWIAYKTASPIGLAALAQIEAEGEIAEFDLPSDIVLFNLEAGFALPVTTQPEGASLFADGQTDNAILRSAPAWSPDGAAVAWSEIAYPVGTAHLVRYEVAAAQARVLADLPPQPNRQLPPAVTWGRSGISVNLSADAASDQIHPIFDAQGALMTMVGIAAVPDDAVRLVTWVQVGDREVLGLLYESGGWVLFDPVNGSAVPYSAVPVLTHNAPLEDGATGWALRFGVDPSLGFYWEIADTNIAAMGEPNRVALSADGTRLAVAGVPSFGTAGVFNGTDFIAIPGTGSGADDLPIGAVLWGAMIWRLPTAF